VTKGSCAKDPGVGGGGRRDQGRPGVELYGFEGRLFKGLQKGILLVVGREWREQSQKRAFPCLFLDAWGGSKGVHAGSPRAGPPVKMEVYVTLMLCWVGFSNYVFPPLPRGVWE